MSRTRHVAQAGAIAAVYAALTLLTLQLPSQLGWGLVQFRLSEVYSAKFCLNKVCAKKFRYCTLCVGSFDDL